MYVPLWVIIAAIAIFGGLGYIALRSRTVSAPTSQAPPTPAPPDRPAIEMLGRTFQSEPFDAQLAAEQLVAFFKADLTQEQKAALNQELAGLTYEEIRSRVAESIARSNANTPKENR